MIFWTSILLGLTANFHCVGMCGPLALAVPVDRKSNVSIISGILQYNLGRIFTYSVFGALVGLIGFSIQFFGFLQWTSIISGILMVLFAWKKWISPSFEEKFPLFGLNKFISKGFGFVLAKNLPLKSLFFGALNGLLPCGMVYLALINAMVAGSSLQSAASMFAYGLGTLPGMVFVAFAAQKINGNMRYQLSRAIPYMLTIVGLLVILRGMNLGIPYLSPKITLKTEHVSAKNEITKGVEMTCCSKPNTTNSNYSSYTK